MALFCNKSKKKMKNKKKFKRNKKKNLKKFLLRRKNKMNERIELIRLTKVLLLFSFITVLSCNQIDN